MLGNQARTAQRQRNRETLWTERKKNYDTTVWMAKIDPYEDNRYRTAQIREPPAVKRKNNGKLLTRTANTENARWVKDAVRKAKGARN